MDKKKKVLQDFVGQKSHKNISELKPFRPTEQKCLKHLSEQGRQLFQLLTLSLALLSPR